MKTEYEKQQCGDFYNSSDKEIVKLQLKSRKYQAKFNKELNRKKRFNILKKWLGEIQENSYIEPNFFCDFGCHLFLGKNVYINTNCTILDSAKVTIGDYTMIGPNVQICTPGHPIKPDERNGEKCEFAKPINIGANCWLGAGVIILPNITIGEGSVIGAGSIVTKDIPPHSVAVGNPCKVIKSVD